MHATPPNQTRPLCLSCGAQAGYTDINFQDMSVVWTAWVAQRALAYASDRPRHDRVHSAEMAANMLRFYHCVSALFTGGNLGGVVLTARMPMAATS